MSSLHYAATDLSNLSNVSPNFLGTCKTACAQVAGHRILETYSTQMVLLIVDLQVCQQPVAEQAHTCQ